MTDILIEVDEDGPDFVLKDGDLALDLGLSTAVLLSLFVDRRADPEDLLGSTDNDPRGWWGEDVGDRWGSRLWLLDRAKATSDSAALGREAALQALAWLVEEGIAELVDAQVEIQPGGFLAIQVTITRGRARRWDSLWASVERGEAVRSLAGSTVRILYG